MKKDFSVSKKAKKILAIYLSWIVLNFILLCFGNINEFNTSFWPFNGKDIDGPYRGYDWFEFFVYTVGPIVIGVIIRLYKESKDTD